MPLYTLGGNFKALKGKEIEYGVTTFTVILPSSYRFSNNKQVKALYL